MSTGPKPQGSEFFVTAEPTPWLNGRHTVFGQVVAGLEVVRAISHVPVGVFNRPLTPVILRHVRITLTMPALDPARALVPGDSKATGNATLSGTKQR